MSSDIDVSVHAEQRWQQRIRWPVDIDEAWQQAKPIGHDFDADEVRYHRGSNALLLRRGKTIVTVLNEATANDQIRGELP